MTIVNKKSYLKVHRSLRMQINLNRNDADNLKRKMPCSTSIRCIEREKLIEKQRTETDFVQVV